jgi:hypothetical protein
VINPKTCQDNAMRCTELANAARDSELQAALFDMAAKWLQAAAELEGSDHGPGPEVTA